ncbi:RcpC/CpaB family pilus assembly protein [Streptomyces hygroscopicus]|uniref:RcpC/CpaB family pilus assembly protein n=2 Tax=Streptomyces hygroscopicus TaxID=1912 RepID=UPI0030D5577F
MSHPSPTPTPTLALPRSAPPARAVPRFDPVRTGRDGGFRLRRAVRRRRRAMAAGLALAAAALAAAAPPGAEHTGAESSRASVPATSAPAGEDRRGDSRPAMVSAPVRIADAAAVRLLHPGDRVDVLATPLPGAVHTRSSAPAARVVARGVRVAEVPGVRGGRAVDERATSGPPGAAADTVGDDGALDGGVDGGGALVVLTVPRADATALAGAAAGSRLAVTLCRC